MTEIIEKLTHPLLPKLKTGKGNKMEGFTKKGIWLPRPSTELDVLSDSISTEEVEFEVNSIPDMWGRPILFELALFDITHPLHKRILGEWRGLLTMLALRSMRQFTGLSVKDVKLPKKDQQIQDSRQSEFLSTLSKIMPEKVLSVDTTWDHLYVILFGDTPIGITTPITLVCTATDYFNSISGVQWYSGKFLLDPIRFLNKDERNAMAFWLKSLKNSIDSHSVIKDATREYDNMLHLLDSFIEDLGGIHGEFELTISRLGMEYGIFKYLDRPVFGDNQQTEGVYSHVRILPSRKPEPTISLLVIDKEIAQQWGNGEQEVIVYNQIPLARIPPEGLVGPTDTIFETTLENAEWCSPIDFFSEKLVLIQQKDAFPGTIPIEGNNKLLYHNQLVTPITPISELLLKYLEPQDISNRMRFEQIGSDEIRVYINFPLSGNNNEGKDFIFNKSYKFNKGEIILQMAVPIIEIWPDFVSPNWNIYYSYFSSTEKDKVFYAMPIRRDESKEWEKRDFKNKANQTIREIIGMKTFPEAYACKTYWIDPNKRLIASDAGVLLLNKPEEIKPIGKSFNIGVDFGASGTNVYYHDEGEEEAFPQQMKFDKHLFQVSDAPTLERVELYDYFLPPLEEKLPFLSIFHDFLEKSKDLEPILDGHIYFSYDPKEFNAGDDRKRMDLKWGNPAERDRARTFLEQLCLMSSMEVTRNGAEKISWQFSFPTAFSQSDEEAILQNWDIISEKIFELTGLKKGSKNLQYESEGVAAAKFFAGSADIKATIPRGAVFIDIGSSTSDISIWGGGKLELLIQTSLRFAGRNMFSTPLWKKTRKTKKKKENYFLNNFFKEEDIEALYRDEVKNNPIAFYAQLDSILGAEKEYIAKRLPNLSNDEKTKEFRQILAVSISGLLYYIGLIISDIPNRHKYIESAPNIYFGGNGSRLLHWLAGGKFNPDSAINHLLKAVFCKASKVPADINFGIHVSPEPKAEVAYGLVWDKTPLHYNKEKVREGYFLAGETFVGLNYINSKKNDSKNKGEQNDLKINESIYQWDEKLTPTIISNGIKLLSENGKFKMEKFEDFIKIFNQYADNAAIPRIPDDDIIFQAVGDHVNHECGRLRNTTEEEIRVESLFITAIKKFIDELVNVWTLT